MQNGKLLHLEWNIDKVSYRWESKKIKNLPKTNQQFDIVHVEQNQKYPNPAQDEKTSQFRCKKCSFVLEED